MEVLLLDALLGFRCASLFLVLKHGVVAFLGQRWL